MAHWKQFFSAAVKEPPLEHCDVAVEISPRGLLFAQPAKTPSGSSAINGWQVPFEKPTTAEQLAQRVYEQELKHSLQKAKAQLSQIAGQDLVCLIPEEMTRTIQTTLPDMPAPVLRNAVAQELADLMDRDPSQIAFDFWSSNTAQEEELNQIHAIAADQNFISELIAQFRQAGLRCRKITTRSLSLQQRYSTPTPGTIGIVDWGMDAVRMSVRNPEGKIYSRSFRNCLLQDIRDDLAKDWEVAPDQASQIMNRLIDTTEVDTVVRGRLDASFREALHQRYDLLADEIRKTINFASLKLHAGEWDQILLTGAGSVLPQVRSILDEQLPYPVVLSHCSVNRQKLFHAELDVLASAMEGSGR